MKKLTLAGILISGFLTAQGNAEAVPQTPWRIGLFKDKTH